MLTTVLGRSMMAERHGSAPGSVLALHGWGRTRQDFDLALAGLDALALDLPGFGTSPAPPTAWSTAEYAAALVPLIAAMKAPVLIGHSFGGRVAAHLAATSPHLLRGVVFTGAPLVRPASAASNSKPALGYRVVRKLSGAGLITSARLEAARRKHGSVDYRDASPLMRGVLVQAVGEDYSPQLLAMAAAGVPTRLIWGAGDTAAPVGQARAAAQLVGAPPPLVLEGSAHLLDPALSAAIRDAAEELLAAGAA